MTGIRILYAGPVKPGGTCAQRLRAFLNLGVEVDVVETSAPFQSSGPRVLRGLFRRFRRIDWRAAGRRIAKLAKRGRYSLLWVDKGLSISPRVIRGLGPSNPGLLRVHFSPDDFGNPYNRSRRLLAALRDYDAHVTTKTFNVPELESAGAARVLFMPNGFDPELHRPMDLSAEEQRRFGAQVAFIGAYEKERVALLEALANEVEGVVMWTPAWPVGVARPEKLVVRQGYLGGLDYARAIAGARINLGFLRRVNRDRQTTRSVEIPACGGFLLAERTEEHEALFAEGREAEFFGDPAELRRKVAFYLDNEPARRAVAAEGRRRCVEGGYSYPDRLRSVLRTLGLPEGGAPPVPPEPSSPIP